MQAKIKSDDSYDTMHEDSDSLALLKIIKGVAYKFESQKNIYLALDDAKSAFYKYHQGADDTNASKMIEVIEHYGGSIGDDKALVMEELKLAGHDPDTATKKQLTIAKDDAKRKAHAIAFLIRSDNGRYGPLKTDLESQYTRGTDQYPINVTDAYNMLVNYKKPSIGRPAYYRGY
jgi:hypothetical protein